MEPLVIDLERNTVSVKEKTVKLFPRSAELLYVLNDAKGELLNAGDIEQKLMGLNSDERCCGWARVHVSHLRKQITGLPISVESVYGRGYRLADYGPRDFLLGSAGGKCQHRVALEIAAEQVAKRHGLDAADLLGDDRVQFVVHARHEFFYETRNVGSLSERSRLLLKDRDTIRHGIKAHERRMKESQK